MNTIAAIVTIFFLLAYFAVNLSCLALDLASAPNFRPTFVFFSWHTALIGAVGSIIMCFIVSPVFASIAIGILIGLIAMLHLRDFPRASWGSISQALIFHQVRKYLLLLDPRKEHVKFWRPQMLLLVANPRSAINLIDFVNDMKKGGLFILGHVKLTKNQTDSTDPCSQEYPHWVSLIDEMKIKAFVDMTSAPTIHEGVMQLVRISGLGNDEHCSRRDGVNDSPRGSPSEYHHLGFLRSASPRRSSQFASVLQTSFAEKSTVIDSIGRC